MSTSLLRVEIADRVATVTLDNPSERNTLTGPMVDEIVAAFDALEADDGVGAVVITGAPPAFCAGANLGNLGSAQGPGFRSIYEGFLRVGRCALPTLAAVNGAAVGAGMNLALCCDVRLAARRAKFDTRFLQLGIHPGGGHTWMLRRAVGPQAAAATVLFGEVLDGAEAERIGLVWRCVDDDDLLATAQAMAARAADAPRELAVVVKETLRDMATITEHDEAVDRELTPQVWSTQQPWFKERLAALQARIAREALNVGAIRELADRYVDAYVELDPIAATDLGVPGHDHELTDFSPDGEAARADLRRRTLRELSALEGGEADELDARCGRLLRERLEAELALDDHHEPERMLNNMASPLQELKDVFDLMSPDTPDEWEVLAQRLEAVPEAYARYRSHLALGAANGRYAAPRQVAVGADQLAVWSGQTGLVPYFVEFAEGGPDALRVRLDRAAERASAALGDMRTYLVEDYGPGAEGTPDAVGPERYRRWVRVFNGTDLDLDDAYDYGWSEFLRIDAEMQAEAERVLPGATAMEAMRHLDEHGHAIEGVDEAQAWLQALMDEAIDALHPTHFDLEGPLRQVEARIAPAGGAAAPYYTTPSEDFSRPGATWLPTQGRTRFPTWELVSTWYHEGVPGHHLQLAEWLVVAGELSRYQTTLGSISANMEGWALYAERLMDELGFFEDSGRRLGFLVGQQLRAVRVVIDIGMHNELPIPTGQAFHPGERWTPELGQEFLLANGGSDTEFLVSEIVRYLGVPGQAIGYKLGERAWLAGRDDARRRRGADFDLKAWHMAALRQGSLGLDDLQPELAAL